MSKPEIEWSTRRQSEPTDSGFPSVRDPATLFGALASARRLALLWTLAEADGQVSLTTASRRIPERERELDSNGESIPAATEVRTTLRHVHVPKLRAVGLVTFDESTETLRLSIDDDRLRDLLDGAVGIGTDT